MLSRASFGSFFSTVATKIQEVAENEKQSFIQLWKEDQSFSKPQNTNEQKQEEVILPVWMGLNTTDEKLAEEVKSQILNLTKSRRNFANAPPEDANFKFDFDKYLPIAQVCLKADPQLSHARFILVPKYIKEPQFWRNYFYRVWIIKEAYGINAKEPSPIDSINTTSTTQKDTTVNKTPSNLQHENNDDNLELEIQRELEQHHNQSVVNNQSQHIHEEDEFVSDMDFGLDSQALNKALDELGVSPPTSTHLKKKSDLAENSSELAVEIDDEWEEQMRKELESELSNEM